MRSRSHVLAMVARDAKKYRIEPAMRLTSAEATECLLNALRYQPEAATTIKVIQVNEMIPTNGSFKLVRESYPSLRELLSRATNIRGLVLRFSSSQNRLCGFPVIGVFNNLVALNVNLPHATLIQFLQSHPHIERLTLGPCNNAKHCPLTDHCRLPALESLTCSPSCIRAVIAGSPGVTTISTTYNDVRRVTFPILRLLDGRPIETFLTYLHIDFDHTCQRLLQLISKAAPGLIVLMLTESKFSSVNSRMPWEDTERWEDGLASLVFLERFSLRVGRPFRVTYSSEDALVRQWLIRSPPSLNYFIVWTGALQSVGRVVHWQLADGMNWVKILDNKRASMRKIDAALFQSL